MHWAITIGRIAGTAIRIHITFLLFLLWIAASDYSIGGFEAAKSSIVFIVLVFACVVAHEFGHILTARAFGVKTPEVTLLPIGGVANMERIPEDPRQELLIAVAGPMVNVAIAAVLMLSGGLAAGDFLASSVEEASLVQRLALINVALVVFNLVPAFPMDGGRVLRALLAMRLGAQRATAIAARLGQIFAFLFAAAGLFTNPMLIFIGMFIYIAAASELQSSAFRWFAKDLRVADGMEKSVHCLAADALLSDAVEMLLATSQQTFPVVDRANRPVGILDRNDLVMSLKQKDRSTPVAAVMRKPAPIQSDTSLEEAVSGMSQHGLKSQVVVDGAGRFAGVLTIENVAEMMMIHNVKPGWNFSNRAK